MNEKSDLLNQLKIDRDREPPDAPRRWLWWAIALALILAVVATLSLRMADAVPVSVAVARSPVGAGQGAAQTLLDASGYVVARRQATVSSKITGKVTEVLIEEGQHVDKDQIVGRLDDTNVRAGWNQTLAQLEYSKAALLQVNVNLLNAERDFKRKTDLIAQHFVSQADLDNSKTTLDGLRAQLVTAERSVDVSQRGVDAAKRNLDDTIVRAPFAGVVTVKAAQPGEIVSPVSAGGGFTRTGIGTIVDMDSLEVEVEVNENFIAKVHAEQPATIKLNAYPDWQIPAYVIAIIPTADRSKATVKVRVGFKSKDQRVLPEMGARVAFLSDSVSTSDVKDAATRSGVLLPPDAVQGQGDTGVVFMIRNEVVERRAVKLGPRSADGQTILAGLAIGDRVAIGDFSKLSDGVRIRVADVNH